MTNKEISNLQNKLILLGFKFKMEFFWRDKTEHICYKLTIDGKGKHYLDVYTIKHIKEESYVNIFHNNIEIGSHIRNKKDALKTILDLIKSTENGWQRDIHLTR